MTIAEFNTCVDSFADNVYRFILKNLKNEDVSKDIVQETFARLWEKRSSVSFDKARTYIFTTAYHTMIDTIRQGKRFREYSTGYQPEVTSGNEYFDLAGIIEDAVNRLPEIQRTLILLRDYEGYSYQEIGDIAGLNESQVKVYIYRARMTLRQYIGSLDAVI